jgi:2-methylcitrate dehydratase
LSSRESQPPDRRTVTERLVDDAYAIEFASLSPDVVAQAKRVLVDCVACAVGGAGSAPARAVESVAGQLGGRPEATVIGSGQRTSSVAAALVNGTMLRYLDYMDTVLFEAPSGAVSATHPSELVLPIVATAEANRRSGRDLIEAIAIAYELAAVLCEALENAPLRDLGWHHATLAPYILPAVAGRLSGASAAESVRATGLAGLHNVVLNNVDADGEEPSDARNVVYPLVAANCLVDLALARAGLGGSERILEGRQGFVEVVGRGAWSLDRLRPGYGCEGILRVWMKSVVACVLGQGSTSALIQLMTDARIAADEVDQVDVLVKPAALAHMGEESRRFPTTKETADHSLYFLSAVAIRDGVVGPAQFDAAVYEDESIRALAGRVELGELRQGGSGSPAAAAVTVRTRDGSIHEGSVDCPPGHPDSPFTDADVERKLRVCAGGRLSDAQLDRFLDTVSRLETLDEVTELFAPLTFAD